jgi:hypothetical protein
MTHSLMESGLPDDVGDNDRRVTPLRDRGLADPTTNALATDGAHDERRQSDEEKVLPLPGWLVKAYFIFPIVLYIPDVIFNYFVYSDGLQTQNQNPLIQASQMALWGFLSIGVVGMAYLLSVLAPWHWGQGHRMQAVFCGIGVIIATGITTWNSLSFRSTIFHQFPTDQWAYQIFPELAVQKISLTMVLIALAPPFWGLFWALVQPTQTGRSLRQLQEGHAEKLLRVQHEAELKRLRAEANAKVREAQLRGMAQTAATAREQAGTLFSQGRNKSSQGGATAEGDTPPTMHPAMPQSPNAGMPIPPPARVTKDDALATFSAPSGAPRRARRVRSARAAAPSERSDAISAPADVAEDDDLSRRGSLDYVTTPGSALPVERVARAPRTR